MAIDFGAIEKTTYSFTKQANAKELDSTLFLPSLLDDNQAEKTYMKNLNNTDLEGADFKASVLRYTDFKNANLKNTNFEKANLQGSRFTNANVEETNFAYTNLENANLQGVDLISAQNLQKANLRGAIYNTKIITNSNPLANEKIIYTTKFPDWLNAEKRNARGMIEQNTL
ncbi:MAG: pentapeptide repeat-containing protein [Alphaproteobacteria bacterium]